LRGEPVGGTLAFVHSCAARGMRCTRLKKLLVAAFYLRIGPTICGAHHTPRRTSVLRDRPPQPAAAGGVHTGAA
ncbi:MAG: hypothetical protein M0Z95_21620, partial [Actinomycetota bacterium]|nr:hypothetical protein [Actinomycetota bacterium]